MLCGLSRAHVSSPLIDVFSFLLEADADSDLLRNLSADSASTLLGQYHAAFSDTCQCLRASAEGITLK